MWTLSAIGMQCALEGAGYSVAPIMRSPIAILVFRIVIFVLRMLIPSPHEAVTKAIRVTVLSGDLAPRVDARWKCALAAAGACASAWGIERGENAVHGPHEAVGHVIRVHVESRDLTPRVDTLGYGS